MKSGIKYLFIVVLCLAGCKTLTKGVKYEFAGEFDKNLDSKFAPTANAYFETEKGKQVIQDGISAYAKERIALFSSILTSAGIGGAWLLSHLSKKQKEQLASFIQASIKENGNGKPVQLS